MTTPSPTHKPMPIYLKNLVIWTKRWRASQKAYNEGKKSFNDLGTTAIQYMDAMGELVESWERMHNTQTEKKKGD